MVIDTLRFLYMIFNPHSNWNLEPTYFKMGISATFTVHLVFKAEGATHPQTLIETILTVSGN